MALSPEEPLQPRHLLVLPTPPPAASWAPFHPVAALTLPVHSRQGFLKQVSWVDNPDPDLTMGHPGAHSHSEILPDAEILVLFKD